MFKDNINLIKIVKVLKIDKQSDHTKNNTLKAFGVMCYCLPYLHLTY